MKVLARVLVAMVPVLMPVAGFADNLTNVQGSVLVNRGAGYGASSGAALGAGDQIMARPGARASYKYPDGCQVNVAPGSVVTVGIVSPCALGEAQTALGGAAGDQSFYVAQAGDSSGVGGASTYILVGGILVLAGGAALILSSNSKSQSP